jgi:hypothetical protein
MLEDEILAIYKQTYPRFRNTDHREIFRMYQQSIRKTGMDVDVAPGGFAVITKVSKGKLGANTIPQFPPFLVGEILVLESDQGKEVRQAGRFRHPVKWGGDVVTYVWAAQNYAYALKLALGLRGIDVTVEVR